MAAVSAKAFENRHASSPSSAAVAMAALVMSAVFDSWSR